LSRQIRVRVSPFGEIRVEAYGFKGGSCESATRAIEDALGNRVNRVRKSDYWSSDLRLQQHQKLGEGE